MYEAYAALLIGTVSAAAAIGAMIGSRHLSPLPYTVVHLAAILVMIFLVTFGYEAVPVSLRTAQAHVSRLIYLGVSSLMFVSTMFVHAWLNRSKRTSLVKQFFIEP